MNKHQQKKAEKDDDGALSSFEQTYGLKWGDQCVLMEHESPNVWTTFWPKLEPEKDDEPNA